VPTKQRFLFHLVSCFSKNVVLKWCLAFTKQFLRGSLAKCRWARKVAPQSVGAGLSTSIWWLFAVKLWCYSGSQCS
jgi:hypothetical protein